MPISAKRLINTITKGKPLFREWDRDYNEMFNKTYRIFWWTEEFFNGTQLSYTGNVISEKQRQEDWRFRAQDTWYYKEQYEFNRMQWKHKQDVRNEVLRLMGLLPKKFPDPVIKHKLILKDEEQSGGYKTRVPNTVKKDKEEDVLHTIRLMTDVFQTPDDYIDFNKQSTTNYADYKNVMDNAIIPLQEQDIPEWAWGKIDNSRDIPTSVMGINALVEAVI